MYHRNNLINLSEILSHVPVAVAFIRGEEAHRKISGNVRFYQTQKDAKQLSFTIRPMILPPNHRVTRAKRSRAGRSLG